MSDRPARVVMLARVPRYGEVKSRLARHAGKPLALRAHVALLSHNASIAAATARATGMPFELHYAGDASSPFFSALARATGAVLVPQAEGDIGVRMLAAARHSPTSSPYPSIVIGSDCGALSVGYLESAVAALSSADVVLGPAEDGGYVLVGQRKPIASLFTGVEWGTEHVAAQTRLIAQQQGLVMSELSLQWDVDTIADWRRYCCARAAAKR